MITYPDDTVSNDNYGQVWCTQRQCASLLRLTNHLVNVAQEMNAAAGKYLAPESQNLLPCLLSPPPLHVGETINT